MVFKPVLLFQIGTVQVFCYQTESDMLWGRPPEEVYWQDTASKNSFGPFNSISAAMTHYTSQVAAGVGLSVVSSSPTKSDNVIYVDFRQKKRVPTDNIVS